MTTSSSGSSSGKRPPSNRPRPLSDFVPALTKDVFGKKNLLFGKMMAEWAHIAGTEIAAQTTPVDLKLQRGSTKNAKSGQAVLHLLVQPGFALEFGYQKSLLIERLNMFFGYAAINDIKITQNSEVMNKKAGKPVKTRLLTQQEQKKIEDIVATVEENDLQTALKNLGKAMLSRRETSSGSR